MIREIKDLSNSELLQALAHLKGQEDRLIVALLEHISEVERRRLFLQLGYTSMFGYLTKRIGYSEGEAYRKIEAARLLKSNPEIRTSLENGSLTLTTMTDVSIAIRAQEKTTGIKLEKSEKLKILANVSGKSRSEAQKTLSTVLPNATTKFEEKKRERIDGSLEITVLLLPDQRRRLDNAKDILAHKGPLRSTADVIDHLSNFFLRQRKMTRDFDIDIETLHQEKSMPGKNPRAISVNLRRAVFQRDAGKCQFKLERGKICGSTYQVELDHIVPVSKGGRSTYVNLRCLCRVHNQWKADELELESRAIVDLPQVEINSQKLNSH